MHLHTHTHKHTVQRKPSDNSQLSETHRSLDCTKGAYVFLFFFLKHCCLQQGQQKPAVSSQSAKADNDSGQKGISYAFTEHSLNSI